MLPTRPEVAYKHQLIDWALYDAMVLFNKRGCPERHIEFANSVYALSVVEIQALLRILKEALENPSPRCGEERRGLLVDGLTVPDLRLVIADRRRSTESDD